MTNNFAIKSGVIQVNDNGYYEMYYSNITNNHAYSISIGEIFVSATTSLINNCIIYGNTVYGKEQILTEISQS